MEQEYRFKVHTAYVAEVKRSLGFTNYDAPNAVEELKQPRKHPHKEKVEAFIKKRMTSICHWLKMCAAEKYQKMNCRIF